MEVENKYASKGVAGSGLGLGIAGTALGLVNGAGGLASLLGVGKSQDTSNPVVIPIDMYGGGRCSENTNVNRFELEQERTIANKDMEIAYWRGQDETNRKISDAYAKLESRINSLGAEVRANKDEQNGINLQQAVYNGTNTAALGCLQAQVAQLQGLTKLVVPNSSVCPGWGNVTITPATTATTTT